jgi:hypothetical protein
MEHPLEIRSYVGVGPLRFGMSQTEVESISGAPKRVKKGFLGEPTEYRRDSGLIATYDQSSGRLVELGFSKNIAELSFDGRQVFCELPAEILKYLLGKDGVPYEFVGFLVLLKLGMTLTGFHDNAIEQMAVTVFSRGRWDSQLPKLQPFRM